MAKAVGFLNDHSLITWEGLQYRYSKHHRIRNWWDANWFPAIVAAATIVTGAAVAVASFIALLMPPNCPS